MADDQISTLISILDDKISKEEATRLLSAARGDVNVALSIFFEGGVPPEQPAMELRNPNRVPLPLEASQSLHMSQNQHSSDDEATTSSLLPSAASAQPEESDPSHVVFTTDEDCRPSHPRERRPGTAPSSMGNGEHRTGQTDGRKLLQAEVEAMQSVLGSDTDEERLRELLLLTGGNIEVALEAFFEMNERMDNIQVDDDSGEGDEGPQSPDARPDGLPLRPVPARLLAGRPATAHEHERRHRGNGAPGGEEPIRPRRPYEELAHMLGSGVDSAILAPLMVESKGDVAKAVELYCERLPTMPPPPPAKTPEQVATEYYLRPEEPGVPVICNVYDLSWGPDESKDGKKKKVNSGLPGMGMGIYHSGIEVYGREVSFGFSDDGSTGVFEVPGRCAAGVMPKITFKEGHTMGYCRRSQFEVDNLLQQLAAKFTGDSYDLLRRNCNHFANELCMSLVSKKIPSYINRPANVGRVAANIISVPAMAIGKLVDGVKKVKRGGGGGGGGGAGNGPAGVSLPVVAAPSARDLRRGSQPEEAPAAAGDRPGRQGSNLSEGSSNGAAAAARQHSM